MEDLYDGGELIAIDFEEVFELYETCQIQDFSFFEARRLLNNPGEPEAHISFGWDGREPCSEPPEMPSESPLELS